MSIIIKNPDWTRDEVILALDLYLDPERGPIDKKNSKFLELSEILNLLPIHPISARSPKFRNVDGVTMKVNNIKAIDPEYLGKGLSRGALMDEVVFREFSNNRQLLNILATNIKTLAKSLPNSNNIEKIYSGRQQDSEAFEGEILYRYHKYRERDPKIVAEKKRSYYNQHKELCCEACGFDFYKFYGDVGKDYIECHHREPLANFNFNKKTKLEDLALVCANCHRMLHRRLNTLTVEELREQLQNKY